MTRRLILLLQLAPLALRAQDSVTYVPAPPLHQNVANPLSFGVTIGPGLGDTHSYGLDLDGDGVVDFTLSSESQALFIIPSGSNAVLSYLVDDAGSTEAANLAPGEIVGPSTFRGMVWQQRIDTPFGSSFPFITGGLSTALAGQFAESFGFVGVRFMVRGEVHYGLLQIDCFGDGSGSGGVLEGYGWNRTAGAPVTTTFVPQPGTTIFSATFNSSNEVPHRTSSHAGEGKFYLSGSTLFSEMVSDYAFRPFSAGIYGPASLGESSVRRVADLQIIPPPPPIIDFFPPDIALYNGYNTLTRNQINDLKAGRLYVNFLSTNFPHGELRGAILSSSPVSFAAQLVGLPPRQMMRAGEASFVLTGSTLAYSIALPTNFTWSFVGIFVSPDRFPRASEPLLAVDTSDGILIPDDGLPGEPGLPGQVLYCGEASLTDEQAGEIKRGICPVIAVGESNDGGPLAKAAFLGEIRPVPTPHLQPILNSKMTRNALVLSWPADAVGFSVQQSSSWISSNWTTISNVVVVTDGQNQVVLPINYTGSQFFRLVKTR